MTKMHYLATAKVVRCLLLQGCGHRQLAGMQKPVDSPVSTMQET